MDVPSWAYRGAKVVCINEHDTHPDARFASSELVRGATYTIRWVGDHEGDLCLLLEEVIERPIVDTEGRVVAGIDYPFAINRFRPLVSQQDDIKTHFQALLDQPMREVV